MLYLITLSLSCASSRLLGLPSLENRTLRISETIAGFEYQWEECDTKFIGICTKYKMVKETYDLNDIEVRKKLINMGFVLRVRDKE